MQAELQVLFTLIACELADAMDVAKGNTKFAQLLSDGGTLEGGVKYMVLLQPSTSTPDPKP